MLPTCSRARSSTTFTKVPPRSGLHVPTLPEAQALRRARAIAGRAAAEDGRTGKGRRKAAAAPEYYLSYEQLVLPPTDAADDICAMTKVGPSPMKAIIR